MADLQRFLKLSLHSKLGFIFFEPKIYWLKKMKKIPILSRKQLIWTTVMCVSRIVAKNIVMIILFACLVGWLNSLNRKKTAWAGMNTGMHMQVRVQLHVCLRGPQSLEHCVVSLKDIAKCWWNWSFQVLVEHKEKLHPSHYLMIAAKRYLVIEKII